MIFKKISAILAALAMLTNGQAPVFQQAPANPTTTQAAAPPATGTGTGGTPPGQTGGTTPGTGAPPGQTGPAAPAPPVVDPTTTAPPIPFNAPGMPASTPGFIYGMYGQECMAGPAVPDLVCRLPSFAVNEVGNGVTVATSLGGFTKCEANYACCQCARIECGSYNPTSGNFAFCQGITLGDNAAKGVQDISVIGDGNIFSPTFGAHMNCDGIESCADTIITASYVRALNCAGRKSCANAIIRVLAVDGFELICSGFEACAGAIIEILFPPATAGNRCFRETHGQSLQFEHIKCDGVGSCKQAKIILNGDVACLRQVKASNIGCNAMHACLGTKFTGVLGDWEYQEFDCAPGGCMGCTYDNPGALNQPCDPNLAGNQFGNFQPGLPGHNVPLLPGQIVI